MVPMHSFDMERRNHLLAHPGRHESSWHESTANKSRLLSFNPMISSMLKQVHASASLATTAMQPRCGSTSSRRRQPSCLQSFSTSSLPCRRPTVMQPAPTAAAASQTTTASRASRASWAAQVQQQQAAVSPSAHASVQIPAGATTVAVSIDCNNNKKNQHDAAKQHLREKKGYFYNNGDEAAAAPVVASTIATSNISYFAVDPENVFAGVVCVKRQRGRGARAALTANTIISEKSTVEHFVPISRTGSHSHGSESPAESDEWMFEKCSECQDCPLTATTRGATAGRTAAATATASTSQPRRRASACTLKSSAHNTVADSLCYPISETLLRPNPQPCMIVVDAHEDDNISNSNDILAVRDWNTVRRSSLQARAEYRVGLLFC